MFQIIKHNPSSWQLALEEQGRGELVGGGVVGECEY